MDLGWLWHLLAGFGITTAVAAGLYFGGVPPALIFVMVPVLAGIGYLRETLQHLDDDPRLTLHRHIEALTWPAGGAAAGLAFVLVV